MESRRAVAAGRRAEQMRAKDRTSGMSVTNSQTVASTSTFGLAADIYVCFKVH